MSYTYLQKTAASSTPTFDKLKEDASKVSSTLESVAKKLNGLADKAEMSQDLPVLDYAMNAAQPAFKHFRELISKGQSEVGDLGDVAKDAKTVLRAAKDMDEAYKACAQAKQDKKEKVVAVAVHGLATSVSHLKNVLSQMVKSYGKTASPMGSPPWHKAAEADEHLSKAYLALHNLKGFFDSMQEIPSQYHAYYKSVMKAADVVASARQVTTNVRMQAQKMSKLAGQEDDGGPELPTELRIWNAMTGDQRVQVAKDADAFKQKSDLKILRACHAHIKKNLDKYQKMVKV